ncbi:MAG: 4-hydroxy-tetrahydrodipicolinate reductase [Lentimicrobium sp.]|jgi:4-hydroxy-tetrahydrodipicolinate reductase|nr:4-hydroxy-tetrahydrodipicolinate reductase [Lentimicrobium sp.]
MKIALSGYGRMGKEVEKAAILRNHSIHCILNAAEDWEKLETKLRTCDVVIDFSQPASAPAVINRCFELNIPLVSGTTGLGNVIVEAKQRCISENKSFFYAPNFSIGVNIFFEINRKLASLMAEHMDYQPQIHEIHHIHKLDAPSGTAIALANDIENRHPGYDGWTMDKKMGSGEIMISSERTGEVPGTHTVRWNSETDSLEITHTAHSREGFALGAVKAAEWLLGKNGFYGMNNLLNLD